MAKKTEKSCNGSSFHNTTLSCKAKDLIKILGEPTYEDNTGEDKVNLEWVCETQDGEVFTIYDWKEYRAINSDEEIEWHIGGYKQRITEKAREEILEMLG
jgi:hypothetical protein